MRNIDSNIIVVLDQIAILHFFPVLHQPRRELLIFDLQISKNLIKFWLLNLCDETLYN